MFISRSKQRKIKAFFTLKKLIITAAVGGWFFKLTQSYPKKPLTLIAMIKNEIDIIDSFTLQALEFFDRVIFIDHLSSDKTSEYLAYISNKYPKIEVYPLQMEGYFQSELMTWAVKTLVTPSYNGWVFILDADEFLPFRAKEELENALNQYGTYPIITMRWLNLAPDSFENIELELNTFREPSNISSLHKVAFQPKLLSKYNFIITQGNHAVFDIEMYRSIYEKCAFPLLHIPVRSRSQIIDKIERFTGAFEVMKGVSNPLLTTHYSPIKTLASKHHFSDDVLAYLTKYYSEVQNTPELIDNYIPNDGRKNLKKADIPFVTSRSKYCEKFSILASKVFAETYSHDVTQTPKAITKVITFNPTEKTFTITPPHPQEISK